eukprot:9496984-Pyramimonas_sp.AAC.1
MALTACDCRASIKIRMPTDSLFTSGSALVHQGALWRRKGGVGILGEVPWRLKLNLGRAKPEGHAW